MMKRTTVTIAVCALLAIAGLLEGQNNYSAPASIMHVVTIKWKPDSTAEQRKAALEGVKKMAAEIPGITRVWIKATKVQPSAFQDAFVIEFADKAAADRYVDHPAHRAWEKIYLPIREQSVSHQITN
jgi:ABC-type glycerol-3-phosphate transport system substrate-binding protein